MLSLHENSIRKLRTFVTVVDSGSFAAAQTVLSMSSATISIQMKELEEQLGMVLCRRGRSGFQITDQGEGIYQAAKSVLGAFGAFNLAAAEIREELAGEIKIGLQANLATNKRFRLSDALRQFHRRTNSVTFKIEETHSANMQSRVLDGRFDLGIGIFPNRVPGLSYAPLFSEEVALYCVCDHPLAALKNKRAVLAQIDRYRTITAGLSLEDQLRKPANLATPTAFSENMDAVVMFVLSGEYLGFLPTHFAKNWEKQGKLISLCPDAFGAQIQFEAITTSNRHQNNVVRVFMENLLAVHGPEPTGNTKV